MSRPMRSTKTTAFTTPFSGLAAARRLALDGSTRVAVVNLSEDQGPSYAVYYLFGPATVDCSGVATADGCVPPGTKESGIPVPVGATHLSLKTGSDCTVVIEEGVTTSGD